MSGDSVYRDEAELHRAMRYSRIHEWLVLVGWLYSSLVSLLALTTGLSASLRTRSERISRRPVLAALLFAAMESALAFVVSLPLSFYSDYVVEHRFGLSNQRLTSWLKDEVKGLAVGAVLGGPLMAGMYLVMRRFRQTWWLVLSALTVPLSVVFAHLAPVLLMPLFNKFEPLTDRGLAQRIIDLAARQGVTVSDVMQMDMSKQTKKANAMFTGLGNTKRIVLGDTMLDEFSPDEIEVVLAHELGHQVHRDIWKLIALSAPTTVVGLFAAHRLAPPIIHRFGAKWGLKTEEELADVAALPLITLVSGTALHAISPLINYVSRTFVEHPADRYALDLTKNNNAFVSAMQKLARMNLSNPTPAAIVKFFLYSHPPIGERIHFGRTYRPPTD